MDPYPWTCSVGWPAKTLPTIALRGHRMQFEDLPGAMDDRGVQREEESGKFELVEQLDHNDDCNINSDIVTYWPRPSCQNRKCTCVNNRCIRSRNIRIWPWPWTGWIEYEIMTLTGRRVDVKLLYNSVHRKFNRLERRCWNEEHVPERLSPQAPQENGKETLLWP